MNEGAGRSVWATGASVAPDLRHILDSLTWQREAACAAERSERTFSPDESGGAPRLRGRLGSAAYLLPLLICSTCSVRRRCLEAGLTPTPIVFRYPREASERYAASELETVSWVYPVGVWGGSLGFERERLRDLPIPEAVAALESTFSRRLQARVAAWRSEATGDPRRLGRGRSKRIAKILGVTAASLRPACQRCGDRLSWARRSNTRWCGAACKQAGYRRRTPRVAA